jgi:hypothetical protein
MHKCPRCNYESKYKYNLLKHLNRQVVCKVLNEDIGIEKCKVFLISGKLKTKKNIVHECKYCGKIFNRIQRLENHNKKCVEKEDLQEIVIKQQKQIKQLMKEKSNIINNNTTNNNNCNNINNVTNVINIHSYKDTDYTVVEKALNECIKKNGELPMGKLIDIIHFNEKFPQNMNVYIANSKTKRIMKFDGERFNEEGRGDKGIEDIFNEKLGDIEEHPTLNDDLKFASDGTWIQFNTKSEIEKKEVLDEMYKSLFNKRERILKRMKERETKLLK